MEGRGGKSRKEGRAGGRRRGASQSSSRPLSWMMPAKIIRVNAEFQTDAIRSQQPHFVPNGRKLRGLWLSCTVRVCTCQCASDGPLS
eukprot:66967-Rhodomonas_salina.1